MLHVSNITRKILIESCSQFSAFTSRVTFSTLASGKLLLAERDGVLTFTFNNERQRNASDFEICDAISGHLNTVANDDSIKMVLFTGKGDYYSSGFNLNSLRPMFSSNDKNSYVVKAKLSIQAFVAALIDFPKPIIAAVNGPVLGLQMTTLALKDYVVCSDTATFQTPFSMIGVAAEGCSSVLFPQVFGFSKANSLLMFSETITASDALACGFVAKVISKQNFEKEVEEMVFGKKGILNSYSYPSILAVKSLSRNEEWRRRMHSVNNIECDTLFELWNCSDFENRIKSFFEKKQSNKRN